jgi:hypothetical protein
LLVRLWLGVLLCLSWHRQPAQATTWPRLGLQWQLLACGLQQHVSFGSLLLLLLLLLCWALQGLLQGRQHGMSGLMCRCVTVADVLRCSLGPQLDRCLHTYQLWWS